MTQIIGLIALGIFICHWRECLALIFTAIVLAFYYLFWAVVVIAPFYLVWAALS